MTIYNSLIEKIIAETKKYSPNLLQREYLPKAKILASNLHMLESEILNNPKGRLFITRFNYLAESFPIDLQQKIDRAGGEEGLLRT